MPIKTIKTSYNSGELSAYMDAREDVNKYHNGASKLINATVLPHGGFVKRSGTEYIATALGKSTLLPFEFSVTDALVLEFSEDLLRFYKNGAIVTDNVGTDDISGLDNVVVHWKLDETEGVTVADDNGGTHDGTASVDIATIAVDGKVNGAFDLDGQYNVLVPDSDDFSFTDNSNDTPFSIACWGKVVQSGTQILLSKWRNSSITSEWRLGLTNERMLQLLLVDISANVEGDRVSQWKLNEDAGNTSVVDDVALQNGVSTVNTSTLAATSKNTGLGTCFDFDGQYAVEINDNAAYSFGNGTIDSPFSIAAWAFLTPGTTTRTILAKTDSTLGSRLREWRLRISTTDHISFDLYDESENARRSVEVSDAIATGWHFMVATYDGSGGGDANDGMAIYIDGSLVSTSQNESGSYTAMENLTTKVVIGANIVTGGSLGNFFSDKIDNVVLFNIELSAANILALWNDGDGVENSTGIEISAVTDDTISDGWHFFCSTYSAPADESTAADGITLYIDGVAIASTAINNSNYTAMQNTTRTVRIGAQRNSAGDANEKIWADKIDEISVFSDVLTPAEIASLYSTKPFSIVSPYSASQVTDVHVTQSADVMYMAHGDVHPKKLSRFGDVDWTLVDVPFTSGPFLEENTVAALLLGFAREGGTARDEFYFPAGAIGTLTATAHSPFNANMIGSMWSIKHTRDKDNKTTTFAKDTNVVPTLETFASGAVFIKGDYTVTFEPVATGKSARLWRKEGDKPWQQFRSFVGSSAFSATEDEDNVLYAMTRSENAIKGTLTAKEQTNFGVVKVNGFTSSTVVTVEVVNKVYADNSTNNAVTTFQWAEGAWSDFRGYPRTVVFFEDRLWWASSTNNPDTLWSSRSGLYEDMSFTDLGLDDEAITFPINDNEVSQIQWMQARQVMAVGAANKEYRFGNPDPDKAVTPADRKATPQTSEGSHTIQPVILKDSIFFFQSLGRKLGKMKFDVITENFDVQDSTMLTYRLFDSGPVDMAVQRVPDSIIWTVREDGIVPCLTYEPNEEVLGWARQIFGNSAAVETPTGLVESVAVIHGSFEDEVWVSVLWDSLSARHIMRFKPRDFGSDVEDAFYVDSGITYDSTPTTTITGLDHLEGETVAVFADGVVQDNKTVQQGAITITEASTVQVGLPYTMKARTMRHSIPQEGTTIQTRIKKITRTSIRFIRSLNGQAGQEYAGVEYLQPIAATFSTESQDTVPNNRPATGGFSEDAYTTIISSDPVPFTALAAMIDIEVEK